MSSDSASSEEVPIEDQPYAVVDSPIALSPGYVADSDPEEDSEDGPVDYPADGGDGDDDDSSDDDEEEEVASKEEEDEHLAPADSVVAPVVDHVPYFEETNPFETDESAATPPSPPACRTTARISIRLEAPMPFPSEEEVERLLALPPPPPSPLISQTPPSAEERLTRGKFDTTPRPARGHGIDYGFIGTLDAETRRQRPEEVGYGIRDRVDGLVEDGQFHYETARLLDQEALVSREAWAHSVGLSLAVYYELQAYRTHTQMLDFRIASQESLVTTLIAHVSSLQGQLSAALGQIQALQARGQTHADDHEGAGSFA
ncbi:hypothetical protein Tco_0960084 [Tanacetum coccineum]